MMTIKGGMRGIPHPFSVSGNVTGKPSTIVIFDVQAVPEGHNMVDICPSDTINMKEYCTITPPRPTRGMIEDEDPTSRGASPAGPRKLPFSPTHASVVAAGTA